MNPRNSEKDTREDTFRRLAPYMNLGWQLVITILLLTLFGWWLDKKFSSSPWLTLSGAILGVAAGLYSFIKTVQKLGKD